MTKIKEVAKSTLAPVVRAYFYAKASWPVWRASTSTARWLYRANRGVQDSVRERVAGDLVKNGIAVASLDELFPGQNLLPTLQSYESALELQAITKTNKLFLQQLWDVVPTLDLENPFIKLMLNRRVLDIVNDYVGSAAIYAYATLNVTLPVPEGAEAQQSQRWHRDPEDRKMCKVFIYLNDVDEGAGPFVYVPGSQRGGKYGTLFPQRPPRGVYPEAGEVEKKIPAEEMKPFTGKAGTVIFADTSGIHKGGYARSGRRIMFTGGFYTAGSVWPVRFVYPSNFSEQLASVHDPIVRFALTATPDALSRFVFDRFKRVFSY